MGKQTDDGEIIGPPVENRGPKTKKKKSVMKAMFYYSLINNKDKKSELINQSTVLDTSGEQKLKGLQ